MAYWIRILAGVLMALPALAAGSCPSFTGNYDCQFYIGVGLTIDTTDHGLLDDSSVSMNGGFTATQKALSDGSVEYQIQGEPIRAGYRKTVESNGISASCPDSATLVYKFKNQDSDGVQTTTIMRVAPRQVRVLIQSEALDPQLEVCRKR